MSIDTQPHPLRHWIPYKLIPDNPQPSLRWLYLGDQKFDSPFFDDTQRRCLSHPYNSNPIAVTSSLDGLVEMAQTVPSVAPSAFIFHVSRCGSTLLSQLLSLNERHIVLPEVPLLDTLLRLPTHAEGVSVHQREQAFQAVLQLLSQKRTGQETHVFVKTDSWHILAYSTLRRLYPTTPFILLYRSPDAVVRSQRNHRGMQAVPGVIAPELFGFTSAQLTGMDLDVYMANVLERYFETFLSVATQDKNCLLVNYHEDGMVMMHPLIDFLGLTLTPTEYTAMQQRCGYHGKHPNQIFREELVEQTPPDYLQPALALYRQLEVKRKWTEAA
ncbi:sulfotransferase [Spirosoma soli]|uniref:Sulfotransferase n=1 Tax=Spirosoma soli TaxID=1770529 RepID=A0ABW5LW65_9BACT